MTEPVQDILIVFVTLAVFGWCWRHTRPMKVYEHDPESATIPPEPYDTRGLV